MTSPLLLNGYAKVAYNFHAVQWALSPIACPGQILFQQRQGSMVDNIRLLSSFYQHSLTSLTPYSKQVFSARLG